MRKLIINTSLLLLLSNPGIAQSLGKININNQFALDFYKQVSVKEKGNIFFSPISLSTAMDMTYAGSKGKTQDQIAKVFHFTSNSKKFHTQQGKILKRLNSKSDSIKLSVINTIWADKTFQFNKSYNKLIKKSYSATVQPVDFINKFEDSRLRINDNIYKSTNQKIKDLLPSGSINNLTRLVLTNAIYFKGDWKIKFEKEKTNDGNFYITPQNKTKCRMMGVKNKFNYYEDARIQTIELPYAGNDFSMIIILPRINQPLDEFTNTISANYFEDTFANLKKEEITVSIPKFKITAGYQLKQILSDMGMPQPFTDDADFSGMASKKELKISDVFHKAFIDVNEEGTEAAAATAVVIAMKSFGQDRFFIANRPFLFIIKEKSTHTILFMGRIVDPTKSE